MAYNRVQDKGGIAILETLVEHNTELRVVDMSYCFLSALCLPVLEEMLALDASCPLKVRTTPR